MATRYALEQNEATRLKIQTTQLIKRLENHALGTLELGPTQIRAIEILLKKTLPDLSQVEHTGNQLHPFAIVPEQDKSSAEWEKGNQPTIQ